MNILCIDTTTKTAAVAIKCENKIYENSLVNDITHSEKLLPLIHTTLLNANLTLDNINLLACINGPGSFTGIRIGLATLKAFSQVKQIPIFSISSLEAIASSIYLKNNMNNTKYIASLIDARNDRVYYGIYKLQIIDSKLHVESICEVSNELIDDALHYICTITNEYNIYDILFAGDATAKFKDRISTKFNIPSESIFDIYPTPTDILNIISVIYDKDNYIFNATQLDATYARVSQAERVQNEKHQN